jgi:uncharacterized protein (TIGR02145 family)
MKKFLGVLLVLVYSCTTTNDGNTATTTVVPLPPTNLVGTLSPPTTINLSWTDNSTNETGFKIERKTGTGTYAVVGSTATDVTTFSDTGLTASTTYTYRVYSYNAGGNSPTYSNDIILTTNSLPVTDINGNVYDTQTICNQSWTKTNLKVTKYRNGDIIPQVTNGTQWAGLTTGAYCSYNNDPANDAIYGKLYNWYAINDPRGLAPVGYHIPTDTEWSTLTSCLGGESGTAGAMKETGIAHWQSPNSGATNSSGFTGLPGGFRHSNGQFSSINTMGSWWSSTEYIGIVTGGKIRSLLSNTNDVTNNIANKVFGLSIRCIKD